MKKILMLLLMTTALLCGCYAGSEGEDVSEYYGELSKAQEIAVIPADASAASRVLTESEELTDFVLALDMEHWELKALPEEGKLIGTFVFSQEETVKLGESAADGTLNPVCEILCYDEIPYLTMKTSNLEMTFKVSDATAEYLSEYFR